MLVLMIRHRNWRHWAISCRAPRRLFHLCRGIYLLAVASAPNTPTVAGVRNAVTNAPRNSASAAAAGANRGGALDVDVEQDVIALSQFFKDFGFWRAVRMVMHEGMFQEG